MAYGKSKDLGKRTQTNKVLRDKAFKTASDQKYDGYQIGLALMVYMFFDKKSVGSGVDAEPNYQLVNEILSQIIRKFKKRKVYSQFRDNIQGVDLADMQSSSKYNKGIKHLLCAIDLFNKYAQVIPLKDKRGIIIVNAFRKIISKGRKPNKIWGDQGGKFYKNLFKKFSKINNIEMYSTYNEGKSVATERFIKTLKNKILEQMIAISKNVYFDMIDNIVNKYNNTVHRTIKMKPIEVKSDFHAELNEDFDEKHPKFRADDRVRISKYKSIFAKEYDPN